MGAGLSSKQLYNRIYGRLRRHMRTLAKAGATDVHYKSEQVCGLYRGEHFRLYYNVMRASNGECCGILKCWSVVPEVSETVMNIIRGGK